MELLFIVGLIIGILLIVLAVRRPDNPKRKSSGDAGGGSGCDGGHDGGCGCGGDGGGGD